MSPLEISGSSLLARPRRMGDIRALPEGGVSRLALSDADRKGRDQAVAWLKRLGMDVQIDANGSIWGVRPGLEDGARVMIGSHIDSAGTGGLYDGLAGLMAGLEVVAALNAADVQTRHPVAVAAFTNEEGARFAPDRIGSGVHQNALDLAAPTEAPC